MPSHLKETDTLPEGVSLIDVIGNNYADVQAGKAATRFRNDLNHISNTKEHFKLVQVIQKRLVAILTNLPNRPAHVPRKVEKPLILSLHELAIDSSHTISFTKGRVQCTKCHNNFSCKDSRAKVWLQSTCIPAEPHRPYKIPYNVIHIGNRTPHSSHAMYIYRGLAYCNNCGLRGASKLVGLANPCEQIDSYGRANLEAIHNNKLPPNMKNWPDELPSIPSTHSSTSLSSNERRAIRGVEAFIRAEKNSKRRRNSYVIPTPLAITNHPSSVLSALNEEGSSSSD